MTPRRPLVLFCLIAAMAPLAAAAQPVPAAAPALAFPGQWAPPPAEWKYPVWPNGCTRFEGEERLACHAFIAADFGRLSRYADANRALAPAPPDQTRVVFFGDSITDRWSQPQSGGFFSGKTYLAGTNDLAGNAGPVTPDQLLDNLMTMSELARLHGIRVVLASILPVSDDKVDANGQPLIRSRNKPVELLRTINRRLAEYAAANGHVYLDYFTPMATATGALRPDLNDDGLHPNKAGYDVMRPLAEKGITAALKK